MSIVLAPPPGERITVWSRCTAHRVYCTIVPREDAIRDEHGSHLHLRYEIATGTDSLELRRRLLPNAVARSSEVYAVEFDAGAHNLNYAGSLYLIGGRNSYDVDIFEGENVDRAPHWHWLTLLTPKPLVHLPEHHTVLAAFSPGTEVMLNGSFPAVLDHVPIPASGLATFGRTGASIMTGWWG